MKARNRRAFSLVELLTVIAIISLLISILLPALGRAREMGRRTVCLANLRSVAQGCIAYAIPNDGHFPAWNQTIAGYAAIGEEWGWDGMTLPAPTIVSPISNTRNLWMLVRNQAGDAKTFICPSDNEAQGPFTPADMNGIYDVQNRSQFSYSFQYQGPVPGATANTVAPGWNTTLKDDNRLVILADATPAMIAKNTTVVVQDSVNHKFDITVAGNVALQPYRDALKRLDTATAPLGITFNTVTAKGEYNLPDGNILPAVNSANHRGEGQNIARLDGSGEFAANPWAGVYLDNIYTVQDPTPYDAAHLLDSATQVQKTELLKARMLGLYEGGPKTYATENDVMLNWVVNIASKTRFPDSFLVP